MDGQDYQQRHGRGGGGRGYHQGGPRAGRGGGRFQGRGRGDQTREHQRSYAPPGHKRGRDDDTSAAPKPTAQYILVAKLIGLCDRNTGHARDTWANDRFFDDILKSCRKDLEYGGEHALNTIIEAAVEVSFKTQMYALVIGILHTERSEFSFRVVGRVKGEMEAALAEGNNFRAKQLMRFLAALAAVNVVPGAWMISVLGTTVDKAIAAATGGEDLSGASWQPWTDYLMYMCVAALPWCARELAESCGPLLTGLMERMQVYMNARPLTWDESLRPMRGARSPEDAAAKSDSGSASFLGELWEAVKECAAGEWVVLALPNVHHDYHQKLHSAQPLNGLDMLHLPQGPAGVSTGLTRQQVVVRVRHAYPPRGGIRLLGRAYLEGDLPAIERFIVEEYIIDSLAALSSDRSICVLTLSQGIPHHLEHLFGKESTNVRNFVAEVLFSQMLVLPRPPLNLASYCTILVDLCKLPTLFFPRVLSSCVRELFACMPYLDPELVERVLSWHSYHLSNFTYQWPWDRWAWVIERPVTDPQRRFCTQLLQRLLRLSYWEHVHERLSGSTAFQELLGPCPTLPMLAAPAPPPQGMLTDSAMADAAPQAAPFTTTTQRGDHDMLDVAADNEPGDAPSTSGQAAMEIQPGEGVAASPVEPEAQLSAELMEWVRAQAKALPERIRQKLVTQESAARQCSEQLVTWVQEHITSQPPADGEAPVNPLRVVGRALLSVGDKSPSHMHTCFERYAIALRGLISQYDTAAAHMQAGIVSPGQLALLELVGDFYAEVQQKLKLALDRMLYLRIIDTTTAMNWLLTNTAPALRLPGCSVPGVMVWEMLMLVLDRTMSLPEELGLQVSAARDRAAHMQDRLTLLQQKVAEGGPIAVFNPAGREADMTAKVQAAHEAAETAEIALLHARTAVATTLNLGYTHFSKLFQAAAPEELEELQALFVAYMRRSLLQTADVLPELQDAITSLPQPLKEAVGKALGL